MLTAIAPTEQMQLRHPGTQPFSVRFSLCGANSRAGILRVGFQACII
jgi:hypothetical protein